jgi:hypothetical protein
MKPSIYIETTIISYLIARPPADIVVQAHQQVTRQWWFDRRGDFELFTSQFVLDEASAGDPAAAAERIAALKGIELLDIAPEVEPLAERLLATGALPMRARLDALHLATATINGMEFLLTWNCKHLANATLWHKMEQTCRAAGYLPPVICTPYELPGSAP